MQLGEFSIAWLENLLLVLGPRVHDEESGIAETENLREVWEKAVLLERVLDKSRLIVQVSKGLPHD